MKISLVVAAYNEENVLDGIFADILAQDYPHKEIELLFIDSASTDRTKQCMELFSEQNRETFFNIQVLDNPKRRLAAGWNIAIMNFKTEAILRVDAHASIPPGFVRKNVRNLENGEMVSGGRRPNIAVRNKNWDRVLLEAESSMFGSSIASYRRSEEKAYVKSIFHGAYRREVLEQVGGFDEMLGRTEDNEFHYRVRKAGYQLYMDPEIVSYQHTRATLRKMCRQKRGNGFWVGVTLGVCPGCLSIFHFVPVCFFIGIIFTTILAYMGVPVLSYLMWGGYWLLAAMMALMAVKMEKKCWQQWLLPFLFFILHISYGVGTLVGLLYMPIFRRGHRAVEKGILKQEDTVGKDITGRP